MKEQSYTYSPLGPCGLLQGETPPTLPLYIKMIARAYELDIERWLRLGIFKLSWDIHVFHLYEKYFERNLHSYLKEKKRVEITNSSVLDSHERWKELFGKILRSVL